MRMTKNDYLDLLLATIAALAVTLPFWGTALCTAICEDVEVQTELDQPNK